MTNKLHKIIDIVIEIVEQETIGVVLQQLVRATRQSTPAY